MRRPKFKHNRKKLNPKEEYNQLISIQENLHNIIGEVQLGKSQHLIGTVFTHLRALICSGNKNMKPLLQRVLSVNRLNFNFYCISPILDPDLFSTLIGAKLWKSKEDASYKDKTNLNHYIDEEFIYNTAEYRFISRHELIRMIADSEGAHFDPEINHFSEWLDKATVSFGKDVVSQKELIMWDLFMLVDWHINRIKIEVEAKENAKRHKLDIHYFIQKRNEIDRINNHYDSQLNGSLPILALIGTYTCGECNDGNLIKINETNLKCDKCGRIKEI